jgi:hypothetical protein
MAPAKKTRKRSKRASSLDKLRKKVPTGDLKVLDAAAVLAASRRRDYANLEAHRRELGDFIKKAGEEYKIVQKHMKMIEEEELHRAVGQLDKSSSWSWW